MTLASTRQYCTFFVDGQFFGVPVQQVQEVIRYQRMTCVPLMPGIVRGLINLRGQIVVAIDLRRCLHANDALGDRLPMNVVVRTTDGAVSLLVDEIGDVVEVEDSSFEPPPETLRGMVRSMIPGVHKLDNQLMHVLDIAKTCQMAEEVAERTEATTLA